MSYLIRLAVVSILCLSKTKAYDIQCLITTSHVLSYAKQGNDCIVTKISGTPNETVTTVNGQNADYYKDQDIRELYIEPNMASFIPKGVGNFFPRLEAFMQTGCEIKSIQKEDLQQFPNLEYLYLSRNKIEFVGKDILEPLTKLEQAYFDGNVCIDKQALTKIEIPALIDELNSKCQIPSEESEKKCEGEIFRLEKLLDALSKNLFETSKGKSESEKIEPTGTLTLTCDTSNETCEAVNMEVMSSNSRIEKVQDENANEIASDPIKKLRIIAQTTLYLPLDLAETFPQLNKLTVRSSGLFSIGSKVLANLPHLTTLDLKGNKIYEIPKGAFESSENLVELDLSFNKIEEIEAGAFQGLEKLEKLRLNDNSLVTISSGIFDSLKTLNDLTLHNNKLKFIDADLLQPLINLQSVDLSNNTCISMKHPSDTLEEISTKIIDACEEPIELNCNFAQDLFCISEMLTVSGYMCKANNLKVASQKTKISKVLGAHTSGHNDQSVAVLAVLSQSMAFLPYKISETFPNLQGMIIDRSALTAIQQSDFEGLTAIKQIIIRHNNLTIIGDGAFDQAVNLEFLDLSSNHIESLPALIFFNLNNLKTLKLSHNNLERLSSDILKPKNTIQEFRADNNQLDIIEAKFIKYLNKASLVDLTKNTCIDIIFDSSNPNSKTFVELTGHVMISCSDD